MTFDEFLDMLANVDDDDNNDDNIDDAETNKNIDDMFAAIELEAVEEAVRNHPGVDIGILHEAAKQVVAPQKHKLKQILGLEEAHTNVDFSDNILGPIKKKIEDQIEDERPTMEKILKAHIPHSAKKQAFEQFMMIKNCEPHTFTYNSIKDTINKLIRPKSTGSMTLEEMDAEESRLLAEVPDYDRDLRIKILNLTASDSDKAVMIDMLKQMESHTPGSSKNMNLKKKLSFMVDLPFQKSHESKFHYRTNGMIDRRELQRHLQQVRERLDEKLYGLDTVKDKIIQIRNNQITCPGSKSILAFKGSAGLGKTSLSAAIAYAFDLPFDKISMGGMDDPSVFKGTDSSWSGSAAQIMLHILRKCHVNNPVVLIDEVEKVEGTSKGISVQYALFEMLDFEQNHQTKDLFINEVDHDLSKVFYIVSMNDDKNLHPALKSRLEIIELPDYKDDEVQVIVQKYLLPRSLRELGLLPNDVQITNQAVQELVQQVGKSDGHYDIRIYRNEIFKIVSKLNYLETFRASIDPNNKKRSHTYVEMKSIGFKGFPFTITESMISQLVSQKQKKVHLSYYT